MGLLHLLSAAAAAAATAVVGAAAVLPAPAVRGPAPAPPSAASTTSSRGSVTVRPGPPRTALTASREAGRTRLGPRALTPPDAARWRWPVPAGSPVLRPFRVPPSPWGAGHRGLDLGALPGGLVRAVEGGVVTHAGRLAGRGTVTVTHADGLRSTYEPVSPLVTVGQEVVAGAPVGRLEPGAGHCGVRACLHLGALQGTRYRDPWPLLTGGRVRLLPRPPP